ncbi:UdgX family uracil-DNA binding protein [Planctomycetes bacterium K23_9]|uniref:Type-4 uracil-DNA glycosylase n=1 Tax=Stieleria marina TaxID=1930275 RepID=A0A517NQ76_9BACT|nr:Uracil DNA glycosylase superfamily protein [Planctomycetes bacterium K23_9]
MQFIEAETFDQWRAAARALIASTTPPDQVSWNGDANQPSLFSSDDEDRNLAEREKAPAFTVPKNFIELAKIVACHKDPQRWELLYRTLWRIKHGEPHLLVVETDDDVHRLGQMRKAVSRDVHKMKAFVRFRRLEHNDDIEAYVAWHRPDHRIVRLAAPFFARRFKAMNWAIFTPEESASWDQTTLTYGDGVPSSETPDADVLEDLWKAYYASIFNPARVKVATMKREMPVRHWPTLPETELIPELLRQASSRVETMIETHEGFASTATSFLPTDRSLHSLANAAECCRACDLHQHATQTVFGRGPIDAKVVLVGEQPGDQEDIAGEPFIGPAGRLLNIVLEESGIARSDIYLTNVVKHFKFTQQETSRGKRRLHKKPDSREIFACRPWLEAELQSIKPQAIVCLGATSAQALFGRDFRITQQRGLVTATEWSKRTIATWHPAAVLRMPDETRRQQMRNQMVNDLQLVGG